jgi:hypothetical protein
MAFQLNIPRSPMMMPPRQQMIKNPAPKLTLPKNSGVPRTGKPFMPRAKRFSPAPNPKQF